MPIFTAKCCAWRCPSALEEGRITYNNVNENAFTKQLFSIMFHKRNTEIDTLGPKMIFWIRMSEADIPISSANTSPFRVTLQTVAFIINGFEIRPKSKLRLSSELRKENFVTLQHIHSMKLLVVSVVGHWKFLYARTGVTFPLCDLAAPA